MTTPAWISSPGSMASAPSFARYSSSVAMLRARKAEEAPGTVAARFPAPMMGAPSAGARGCAGPRPAPVPPRRPARHVHHDRARGHGLDRVLGDQDRRLAPGHLRGGDDHVVPGDVAG